MARKSRKLKVGLEDYSKKEMMDMVEWCFKENRRIKALNDELAQKVINLELQIFVTTLY